MSTISLRLPASLHKSVRELAKKEDVSINQLITTALAIGNPFGVDRMGRLAQGVRRA